MKFNLTPILLTLNKISQTQLFKDHFTHAKPKERRAIKDKLIYRLMFDKMRSDDHNETTEYIAAAKEMDTNESTNKTDK